MRKIISRIDWWLLLPLLPLFGLSIATNMSFTDEVGSLAGRQLIWVIVSLCIIVAAANIDFSFLKKSKIIISVYGFSITLLLALLFFGNTVKGATSWFDLGGFSFQPADLVKLVLILVLAKYLARRHVEIKSFKHIIITGIYFLIPFVLIFLQPDFGSAIIFACIWLGLMLVSGVSKKHLLVLFGIAAVTFISMWLFVFQDYQKDRIRTFVDPLSDIQGTGYNAYQSTIAVGSGQLVGKGVGFGTQSRLQYLPEYETDFVFAAVSEEWGFIGSMMILCMFAILLFRLLWLSGKAHDNFDFFVIIGTAIYFMSHILINVGMNIGIMPVTGVPLPFISYGGSHLVIECLALGMIMSLAKNFKRTGSQQEADLFLR
mgnify:CR=1 FL=1